MSASSHASCTLRVCVHTYTEKERVKEVYIHIWGRREWREGGGETSAEVLALSRYQSRAAENEKKKKEKEKTRKNKQEQKTIITPGLCR